MCGDSVGILTQKMESYLCEVGGILRNLLSNFYLQCGSCIFLYYLFDFGHLATFATLYIE